MVYQISGCSDRLKQWIQCLFDGNNIEYALTKAHDGWQFDLFETKEMIWEATFLDYLKTSGLPDTDKKFLLQVF